MLSAHPVSAPLRTQVRALPLSRAASPASRPPSKKQVAKPVESFFRIFTDPDDSLDEYADTDMPSWRGRGGGDAGLVPLYELQNELVLRLKDDAVPRATLHYIHGLSGIDPDEEFGFDDEFDDDGGSWEAGPPPPPYRR